jgi:hypothetical protein
MARDGGEVAVRTKRFAVAATIVLGASLTLRMIPDDALRATLLLALLVAIWLIPSRWFSIE